MGIYSLCQYVFPLNRHQVQKNVRIITMEYPHPGLKKACTWVHLPSSYTDAADVTHSGEDTCSTIFQSSSRRMDAIDSTQLTNRSAQCSRHDASFLFPHTPHSPAWVIPVAEDHIQTVGSSSIPPSFLDYVLKGYLIRYWDVLNFPEHKSGDTSKISGLVAVRIAFRGGLFFVGDSHKEDRKGLNAAVSE